MPPVLRPRPARIEKRVPPSTLSKRSTAAVKPKQDTSLPKQAQRPRAARRTQPKSSTDNPLLPVSQKRPRKPAAKKKRIPASQPAKKSAQRGSKPNQAKSRRPRAARTGEQLGSQPPPPQEVIAESIERDSIVVHNYYDPEAPPSVPDSNYYQINPELEDSIDPYWKARFFARFQHQNIGGIPFGVEDNMSPASVQSTTKETSECTTPAASDLLFKEALFDRTILVEKDQKDPNPEIVRQILSGPIQSQFDESKEQQWLTDLRKSEEEHEAIYQHTVMMEFLDRHNLGPNFDYTGEAVWQSPAPPSRAGFRAPRPKPDLMIGFRRLSIIDNADASELGHLRQYMYPEGLNPEARAFPFFFVEAKGKVANERRALRQCLNVASLALYNLWIFTKADAQEEKKFLKTIRVFTVTAHAGNFILRTHWVEINKRKKGFASLMYCYQQIFKASDAGPLNTRQYITNLVKNVLRYGEDKILPILQSAVPKTIALGDYACLKEIEEEHQAIAAAMLSNLAAQEQAAPGQADAGQQPPAAPRKRGAGQQQQQQQQGLQASSRSKKSRPNVIASTQTSFGSAASLNNGVQRMGVGTGQ